MVSFDRSTSTNENNWLEDMISDGKCWVYLWAFTKYSMIRITFRSTIGLYTDESKTEDRSGAGVFWTETRARKRWANFPTSCRQNYCYWNVCAKESLISRTKNNAYIWIKLINISLLFHSDGHLFFTQKNNKHISCVETPQWN